MPLDAILIADYGQHSLSGSSPLRLELDGRVADIQTVLNYISNNGKIVHPIEGDGVMSWSSAPKLNGIYLYHYLAAHGLDIELIDNYAVERHRFVSLLSENPKTVVISTTFIYRKKDLKQLVDDIRSLAPGIFIICGGPFVYLSYLILQRADDELYNNHKIKSDFVFSGREEPSIDLYVISPRGERSLLEGLKRIKKGRPIDDLPNSAIISGPTYLFGPRVEDFEQPEGADIRWDSLPAPFFKTCVIPMQASTGCPNKCAFCNFTKHRKLLSVKAEDRLVDELASVSLKGIKYVWFVDDNFRLGTKDLNLVCQKLVEADLGIQWMSFIHISSLKDVDVTLLHKSGCKELRFGLESANSQILKNMRKKVDPSFAAQTIGRLLDLGINCTCYFLIGFPGETSDTVSHTRGFLKGLERPDTKGMLSWSLYPFMLAPMSPIFEKSERQKYGLEGYMNEWKHRTMNSAQARKHVFDTFMSLSDSSPIYRSDNLELLESLTPNVKTQFMLTRHHLSKLALTRGIKKAEIVRAFANMLSYFHSRAPGC